MAAKKRKAGKKKPKRVRVVKRGPSKGIRRTSRVAKGGSNTGDRDPKDDTDPGDDK